MERVLVEVVVYDLVFDSENEVEALHDTERLNETEGDSDGEIERVLLRESEALVESVVSEYDGEGEVEYEIVTTLLETEPLSE